MNTTIDLKTAKTIEAMNQKINHMSALTKIKQDTFLSKFILISNPSRRWNRSLPDLSRRDGSLKNTI